MISVRILNALTTRIVVSLCPSLFQLEIMSIPHSEYWIPNEKLDFFLFFWCEIENFRNLFSESVCISFFSWFLDNQTTIFSTKPWSLLRGSQLSITFNLQIFSSWFFPSEILLEWNYSVCFSRHPTASISICKRSWTKCYMVKLSVRSKR